MCRITRKMGNSVMSGWPRSTQESVSVVCCSRDEATSRVRRTFFEMQGYSVDIALTVAAAVAALASDTFDVVVLVSPAADDARRARNLRRELSWRHPC